MNGQHAITAKRTAGRVFRNILFVLLGTLVFGIIVAVKSKTAAIYWTNWILLGYTILVTCFELSRVVGAMFFERLDAKIMSSAPPISSDMGGYEPVVSIVIPCKNEEKSITKTVMKCFNADYPAEKLEVIVVNDGSTDNTGKILRTLTRRYERLTVVHWRKNRGKRFAMAEGFNRARGEIVVQLDSDSYIDPTTFRNIIRPFYHQEIGAVCAHADPENAEENLLTRMQAAYYFLSFRILKAAESVFATVMCCSGCCSAYRKSVVQPVLEQWLQEKFLGLPITWGDDRALTNWVLRLGYQTIYTDKARAFTIVPNTLLQFMKQQVRWKKGWFVNSIFATRFMYRTRPFVFFTYFLPLIILTLATPFIAARALVYNPLVYGVSPFYYIAGIFLVACIITIYYKYVAQENRYWHYVFFWSGINLIFLSFVLLYALVTIQNRKWGTR